MNLHKSRFLIILICLFWLVGCQSEDSLKQMTFEEIYPANLSDVTKIEIRHGSGELATITDVEIIGNWVDDIKDITFEPDENQEEKVGYMYSVKLFEENDVKIFFHTSKIEDFYYIWNERLVDLIEETLLKS